MTLGSTIRINPKPIVANEPATDSTRPQTAESDGVSLQQAQEDVAILAT
jgi:hypothetical protein